MPFVDSSIKMEILSLYFPIMKGFRGFTLVELMVVLAVMGVLLALSTPMGRIIKNNAASANVREFVSTLNLARSTAVSSGATVIICRPTVIDENTGEQDCLVTGLEGDKSWEGGWVMFIDANNDNTISNGTTGGTDDNNNGTPDSAEDDDQLIRVHEALPYGYTLKSGNKELIQFSAMGLANGSQDTWILCPPSNDVKLARGIILASTGRVKFAEDTNGDGVREKSDGTALSCL